MQMLLDLFLKLLLVDGIIFVLIILGILITIPFTLIKGNILKQTFREEIEKDIKDGSISFDDLYNVNNMLKHMDKDNNEDKKSK